MHHRAEAAAIWPILFLNKKDIEQKGGACCNKSTRGNDNYGLLLRGVYRDRVSRRLFLEMADFDLGQRQDQNYSGQAASRAAAIEQALEEIGEGLRANASPEPPVLLPHQIHSVLHILHGARGLPSAEAVAALRPFLNAVGDRVEKDDPIAVASVAAVDALIHGLENQGIANDDLWEEAIESSLSFANEVSYPSAIRSAR